MGDGIKEVGSDLRLRYKSISPLKETGDFNDSEFYGFSDVSKKIKIGRNSTLGGLKGEGELTICNGNTDEWEDARKNYDSTGEYLGRQVSLIMLLGKLRESLSGRDGDREIMQKPHGRKKDNINKSAPQF